MGLGIKFKNSGLKRLGWNFPGGPVVETLHK